ncbi:MAG: hypothetical protein SFX74_03795 [Fimbriimonadaceae bacterium]|nr:hypothetical protein [Fimbriimonadaceae bacterium]
MLGVLISLLIALGGMGLADRALAGHTRALPADLRWGVAGLTGLLAYGWLTFWIGHLPGGLRWAPYAIAALAVVGLVLHRRWREAWDNTFSVPQIAPYAILGAVGIISVLAPSTELDWDSLAYHLAVPKIWMQAGQITFISFIHHSNFPFALDNLFISGLALGGESGAKAFMLIGTGFAMMAASGYARREYGDAAAPWASWAVLGMPMVLWLSGTAYIDIAQGAYAGLAILFLASWFRAGDRSDAVLAAIMLGGAMASKYTGLQTYLVTGLITLFAIIRLPDRRQFPIVALVTILPLAIAAPWYVRNVVNTGNPVYPFFYSALKGKNWSDYNAKIYANEQQTFGAGREFETKERPYTAGPLEPARIGGAILGLAYQPGRYINPGPTQGSGLPMGTYGPIALLAALFWAISGRSRRFEATVLGVVLISFAGWFFLSQQSRYIFGLMFPLTVLAAGITRDRSLGRWMQASIGLQALVGVGLVGHLVTREHLPVATGQVSPREYRLARTGFATPADALNTTIRPERVALYDEVFGYLLDVPYFWANPGHTTELGYADMTTCDQLVDRLRALGISHVYVNFGLTPAPIREALVLATGLAAPPVPIPSDLRAQLMADEQSRWKPLLAEAIASGRLELVEAFGNRIIFRVAR